MFNTFQLNRQTREWLRITFRIGLFVLIIGLFIGSFFYGRVKQLVLIDLQENARSSSAVLATLIEQDPVSYRALVEADSYEAGKYDEEYYNRMLALFRELKAEIQATYIVTEKYISDEELMYIFDAEDPEGESFTPIGTLDSITPEKIKSFKYNVSTTTGLIDDPKWGRYLTGSSPINDPKTGEVLGLASIDYSTENVRGILRRVLGVVVTGVIFFILGMTILISQWVMADRKAKSSDYLTGLKSRFYFENNLPQMVAEARHTKQPLTVMMIDMDDFASVNNRFGHQVGDSVLVRVGKFIQSNMRSTDILARYGGDEFVGILPGIRGLDAVKIAERIVKQINQTPFEFASGDSVRMSVSIGLAEYEPGMSVQELVKQADEQMYNAKVAGKNQVAYGTSIKAQYQRIR